MVQRTQNQQASASQKHHQNLHYPKKLENTKTSS